MANGTKWTAVDVAAVRSLVADFPVSSRSLQIRRDLADIITQAYIDHAIERPEYHAMMAEVR